MFRGGSWDDDAFDCRTAFRGYNYPTYSYFYIGFRSVLPHIGLPVITVQPLAQQQVAPGDSVMFTIAAIGDAPLSYQWQENGT